ncbi:hypothetical protein O181_004625 [Austropuccinia psidii MF-1]|uniref:Uncharacterized protein n=1 Tax=Austropuccinia psidii MF-1 TaxID=1389203 RepID=A0A9Q3BHC3_9BASI|nr:hypothetical protein [Austropuccinia psidii MF-1]
MPHCLAMGTGAGLTETDLGMTIEQKLKSMCPFYNFMDNIFGKKANVEALDKRDSTKSMAVMSEGEGESDIETSSNSDSGLSAYELQQRLAKRKLCIPRNPNVEDIPTSITPVSDTKSCVDESCGVTDPKIQSGEAKGHCKNLKDINDQKDRDKENFHMKLFENFITMQKGKWMAEESILKEKSECKFNLEKEKFEQQLHIDTEQKEKDKVKSKRGYSLEREKFDRQLCIDAEEKDRHKCEFKLEKERMECQFQLEKE